MFGSRLGEIVRHLRRITDADATSDGQLLQRFALQGDEAAFAALLERHGPMVLGVCRRVLGDAHDAEDAFQATFLVLAHKARSIGRPQALASWLYCTARRTARRARGRRDRRRARESVLDDPPAPEGVEDALAWHELRPALDEAVGGLPRKYRDVVVLCYLQEKTYADAARELGLAAGTVSSRLARARDLLRKRLVRRGLALSSSLLVTLLSRRALSAAVPAALRDATSRAVLAGVTAAPVAALTAEVLRTMFLTKLRSFGIVLLAAGLGLSGLAAGISAQRPPADPPASPDNAAPADPVPENGPGPRAAFENAFGYVWAITPQDVRESIPHLDNPAGFVTTGQGAVLRLNNGPNGELVFSLAWGGMIGKLPVEYRPVVLDAQKRRYFPSGGGGGNAPDGNGAVIALRSYWLSPKELPPEKVCYVGVEVLTLAGKKAIDARAVRSAREAGIEVLPPAYIGKPYDFTLTTTDGKKLRARDLRGKVIVIDCWASRAMREMAALQGLHTKHCKDGLEIVGVNLDTDAEKAKKAIADEGLTWPQVFVPADKAKRELWNEAAGEDRKSSGYTRLLFIDRKGILRTVLRGAPYEIQMIPDEVARLLREAGPDAPKADR